jgi:Fe-S-cluster containining protein
MRFEPIPSQYFAEFHDTFHGDTPETFRVCAQCGGACEFNKIGTLMPGEREYMAAMAGMPVAEFSDKFLDILVMEDGRELDVLRLINGCPFLDRGTFECNCRTYKVVLCEINPVDFQVQGERVQFGVDDWCPLADTFRFRRHFLKVGVAAVSRLPVPVEWYRHVARYDDLYFDYVALEACREDRSKLQTFTFEELLRFQRAGLENDPKQRFHPYPDEVLPYQEPIVPGLAPAPGPAPGRGLGRRG